METETYTRKAAKYVSLVAVTMALSSLFAYVLRIILWRNLPSEDFGLFYSTISFMMFLLIFRDFGLGNALVKFIAQYHVKKDYSKIKTLIVSAFSFQLLTSSLLIISFIIFSSFLSIHYFKSTKAATLLLILAVYVFFSLLCNLSYRILNGFQEVKWYSLVEPLRLGFTVLAFFPLFYLGFGIFAPALAFVVGVTLTFFIITIGTLKYTFILKYPLKDFKGTVKELFTFATPVIFTGMAGKVVAHLDVLILTYFVSLSEVGIYNVVLPTALLFLFFGRAMAIVLFPMASELWSLKDNVRLSKGVELIYKYSFIFTVPLILSVFVFADFFIDSLFRNVSVLGILAFRIILLGVLLLIVATNNHTLLSAIGKPFIVTKIITVAAVVNIILNVILIKPFGIVGAAIATAVSYLIMFVLSTVKVRSFVKTISPWRDWLKIGFLGIIFLLSVSYLKEAINLGIWTKLIVSILSGIGLYILILFLFNLIDRKEIKKFFILIKR